MKIFLCSACLWLCKKLNIYMYGYLCAAMLKAFLNEENEDSVAAIMHAIDYKYGKTPLFDKNLSINIVNYAFYDKDIHTLSFAAGRNNMDLMHFLLTVYTKEDLDDDVVSAACAAASRGHLDMIIFLMQYVSFDHTLDALVLCTAIANGQFVVAKYLLARGVDATDSKRTIIAAAKRGNIEMLEYLLNHLDIDLEDGMKWAIQCAAQCGYFDMVKYLIERGGAPIDISNAMPNAMPNAIMSGNIKLVQYLIECGADNIIDGRGLFVELCRGGHLDMIKFLTRRGIPPYDGYGGALLEACEDGHFDIVKYLMENGVPDNFDHEENLPIACANGHLGIVKLLVENGASVDVTIDFPAYDPMYNAVKYDHFDIAEFLESAGGSMFVYSDAPLRFAALYGHLDIVKSLLEKGADLHACDDGALASAAAAGHLPIVVYLLSKGARVHASDDRALRFAAENDQMEIVRYLIENEEYTQPILSSVTVGVIESAAEFSLEMVKYLVACGADVHHDDDIMIIKATERDDTETVKFLLANGADVLAQFCSPLSHICNMYNWEIIGHLRRMDRIDINSQLLYWAAKNGDMDFAVFVMMKQTDVRFNRNAAIDIAIRQCHTQMVKYLLECGADLSDIRKNIIADVTLSGQLDMVELLVEHGFDIHADNDLAFINAARSKRLDIMQYLLNNGANFRAHNDEILRIIANE
jgi:ankyrin repeat protein